MFDFGCHRLELLLSLFGPVRETVGLTANVVFDREVEDTAVAAVTVCQRSVRHRDGDTRGDRAAGYVAGLRHVGLDSHRRPQRRWPDVVMRDGQERHEAHPPAANIHQPLVEDFVDALRMDRAPLVDGTVGRAVAEIEARIYAPMVT